ncbi:hypothetical protein OG21DRAFT_1513454 [Imleria badia]|nr:hypothetical protein OG21DRAFT_1513454 [Imleria badia]
MRPWETARPLPFCPSFLPSVADAMLSSSSLKQFPFFNKDSESIKAASFFTFFLQILYGMHEGIVPQEDRPTDEQIQDPGRAEYRREAAGGTSGT